jgi:hypothetical protein
VFTRMVSREDTGKLCQTIGMSHFLVGRMLLGWNGGGSRRARSPLTRR